MGCPKSGNRLSLKLQKSLLNVLTAPKGTVVVSKTSLEIILVVETNKTTK